MARHRASARAACGRLTRAFGLALVLQTVAACGEDDCGTCADVVDQSKYCGDLMPFCEDGDHELACNMVAGCLRNSCGTTCPSGMRQLSEPGCGACATEHCSSELSDCENR